MDELVPWLRQQVRARLDLAREACPHTDGHWWRRTHDLGDGGTPEPVGHLYAGEQFLNDPRDAIARCESELAILDEHAPYACTWPGGSRCTVCASSGVYPNGVAVMEAFPCRTIRLLGHGYRHRPGYLTAWKPTG